MALQIRATLTVNQASTILTLTDTTGVYNATSNPYGYGAPNRAVANNVVTELIPTFPSGTVGSTITLDGTTLPTTDFIPLNALTRPITVAQSGEGGTEFALGVQQWIYRVWMTTPSAGLVGVTNGSSTVTIQSAQNFTVDFADSYKIRINGVNYTIAAGGITAGVITLTENYAGVTDAVAVAYIGYQTNVAVMIPRPFLVCFQPKLVAARPSNCNKATYTSLSKLLYQYEMARAMFAYGSYDDANNLLIDLGVECDCISSTISSGGCSSCI